ncbi:MAG TPA: hypothetical protein VF715_02505 [Thermoleophilaceae bacterium]
MTEIEKLSLLERPPPAWARLRLLLIAAGGKRGYVASEWTGALVVVERGRIELECLEACRWPFAEGSVLCLAQMPLRAVHNPGPGVTVLSVLSKRRTPAPKDVNQQTERLP